MLDNITLGQYYPVDSPVHRLDPRMKLILLVGAVVGIFLTKNLLAFIPVLLFLLLASRLSKVPAALLLKGLKPLRFILIFTFVLNLFFLPGETVLLDLRFAKITAESLLTSVQYALRLVFLVSTDPWR